MRLLLYRFGGLQLAVLPCVFCPANKWRDVMPKKIRANCEHAGTLYQLSFAEAGLCRLIYKL